MIRRLILFITLILSLARPTYAQIGCVNGVLADPRAYFFDQIGRREGNLASDWEAVLKRLQDAGMRINPEPGAPASTDTPYFGITLMVDAGGHPRGRIFLPTTTPDGLRYYTQQIQVIGDDASGGNCGLNSNACVWAWRYIDGGPYVPRACGSAVEPLPTPPVTPPVTPTPPVNEELRAALASLQQALSRIEGRLSVVEEVGQSVGEIRAAVLELKTRPWPEYSATLPLRLGTLTLRPRQ